MMQPVRRIGFKHYDNVVPIVAEVLTNRAENVVSENNNMPVAANEEERVVIISQSHAKLINDIQETVNYILGENFSKDNEETKVFYVSQLMNFSELNAELTMKTNMLIK